MTKEKQSTAQAIHEPPEIMAFEFNAKSQSIRNILVEEQPWFVAKDVCSILGLSDTNKALTKLDADEKLTRKIFVSGQNRNVWTLNESGLYALILRSNKPEARVFRKWVTNEVLPAIRKRGSYSVQQRKKAPYIDARDVPYTQHEINGRMVRCITIDGKSWLSMNDLFRAIGSATSSNQASKRLNVHSTNAQKIWIFGATHPAWFTNELGAQLLMSSSRVLKHNQLKLELS